MNSEREARHRLGIAAATGLDGLRELESDAGYVAASEMQEWLNLRQHCGEV